MPYNALSLTKIGPCSLVWRTCDRRESPLCIVHGYPNVHLVIFLRDLEKAGFYLQRTREENRDYTDERHNAIDSKLRKGQPVLLYNSNLSQQSERNILLDMVGPSQPQSNGQISESRKSLRSRSGVHGSGVHGCFDTVASSLLTNDPART